MEDSYDFQVSNLEPTLQICTMGNMVFVPSVPFVVSETALRHYNRHVCTYLGALLGEKNLPKAAASNLLQQQARKTQFRFDMGHRSPSPHWPGVAWTKVPTIKMSPVSMGHWLLNL